MKYNYDSYMTEAAMDREIRRELHDIEKKHKRALSRAQRIKIVQYACESKKNMWLEQAYKILQREKKI